MDCQLQKVSPPTNKVTKYFGGLLSRDAHEPAASTCPARTCPSVSPATIISRTTCTDFTMLTTLNSRFTEDGLKIEAVLQNSQPGGPGRYIHSVIEAITLGMYIRMSEMKK